MAGVSSDQYWESTLKEVVLTIRAYSQREKKRQLEAWRRSRSLEYLHYCINTKESDRVSIFEYQPLEGDPTPEEIANTKQTENTSRIVEAYESYKEYEKLGLI